MAGGVLRTRLDEEGLPIRISHAPMSSGPHFEPLWTTLELHEFGAPVLNPLTET
jgi:hypothetical protein